MRAHTHTHKRERTGERLPPATVGKWHKKSRAKSQRFFKRALPLPVKCRKTTACQKSTAPVGSAHQYLLRLFGVLSVCLGSVSEETVSPQYLGYGICNEREQRVYVITNSLYKVGKITSFHLHLPNCDLLS